MLGVYQYIINTLKNDATLSTLVGGRIFPAGLDVFPEAQEFPLITVKTVSEVSVSVPINERRILYQVSVWSRDSQTEIETIAERVIALLNFQRFRGTGADKTAIHWQRENAAVDLVEADRRIWQKAMTFVYWARPDYSQ